MSTDDNRNLLELSQKTRIQTAIANLEDVYPLWYCYAYPLNLVPIWSWCKTAAIDGRNLYYNPKWIESLSDPKLLFLIIHEVAHLASGHLWRMSKCLNGLSGNELRKTASLLGEAKDEAIHQWLVPMARTGDLAHPVEFPEEGCYNPDFAGMSAEEIFEILKARVDLSGHSDQVPLQVIVGDGDAPEGSTIGSDDSWILVVDPNGNPIKPDGEGEFPGGISKEDLQGIVRRANQEVEDSLGLSPGIGSSDVERTVDFGGTSVISWQQILASWIIQQARADYSWYRPNRSYLSRGMIVPSLKSEFLTGVLAIDTSRSIDKDLLSKFIVELEAIRISIPEHELVIVCCDSKVKCHISVRAGEPLDFKLKGGGGTSFQPVFTWVAENVLNPAFLVYFTDGENYGSPPVEPSYPVLWALFKTKHGTMRKQSWGVNLVLA